MVSNIFAKRAEVAFVFESPHIDEVARGYPLAGVAGRQMTWHIFERRDVPFGLIALAQAHGGTRLLSKIRFPPMKPFSIMNASREPLQESAYIANGLVPPHNISLKARLRSSPKLSTQHRNVGLSEVKEALYRDFKRQCANLADGTLLVPCGNVARAFCEELHSDPQCNVECFRTRVPHPAARGSWVSMDEPTREEIRRFVY